MLSFSAPSPLFDPHRPPILLRQVAAILGQPMPPGATPEAATPDHPGLATATAALDAYAARDLPQTQLAAEVIAIQAVFMDACRRAVDPSLPHTMAIRLHRSIATLGRALANTRKALHQRQTVDHAEIQTSSRSRDSGRQDPLHQDAAPAPTGSKTPTGSRTMARSRMMASPPPTHPDAAGEQDPMHQNGDRLSAGSHDLRDPLHQHHRDQAAAEVRRSAGTASRHDPLHQNTRPMARTKLRPAETTAECDKRHDPLHQDTRPAFGHPAAALDEGWQPPMAPRAASGWTATQPQGGRRSPASSRMNRQEEP